MGEKKSTEIKYLYDEIIKSQNLEKAMYKELETYKTSKEKTLEIVRQINAYVIQRRKILSKYRTMCYEECGKCEKKEDSDKPIEYTKLEKKVTWGNDIKKLHKKPYKKCKEECNKDNNCVGFTWRNVRNWRRRKCILKNKIGKIRNSKRWTLFQKDIEDEDENEINEVCSKFENAIDEEERLNVMKNELTQRLKLTLPLESNTLKSIFLNTYSDKYYSSTANIMRMIFLFFLLLNIVFILQLNLQQLPVFIFNITKILLIGYFGTKIYISYQDHYTRDNVNYDKYNFANDGAQYSMGTTQIDDTNVDTNVDTNIDTNIDTNVNELVLDLCENGNCCPDQMFFDNIKGKCVVGVQGLVDVVGSYPE